MADLCPIFFGFNILDNRNLRARMLTIQKQSKSHCLKAEDCLTHER